MENFTEADKQIVRDMKGCFRAFNLPIHRFEPVDGSNIMFTSQIRNDHFLADVGVTYSKILGHVGIDISLHLEVPSGRMAEVWELLNLFNQRMPVHYYASYQSLNMVSLRANLLISEGCLPIGKFKRLLYDMIENTSSYFPLIAEVVEGANPKELYDRFIADYKEVMEMIKETKILIIAKVEEGTNPKDVHDRFMDDNKEVMKMKSGISPEEESKILSDMELVLASIKKPIKEHNRLETGFVFTYWDQRVLPSPFRILMLLFRQKKMVVMTFTPSFTVPDEKVPVITELIGRITSIITGGCLFFNRETRQVIFQNGILIDNGLLDKKEFKYAVRLLFHHGCLLFPIIEEQILSNQTPEALEAKIVENAKGYPRL